jgi:hydrogen peroxide-dependent heme synthase
MPDDPRSDVSLRPSAGWHCTHAFYRFDRARLAALGPEARAAGCRDFAAVLDPAAPGAPHRLQTFVTSGHKADFGLLALDPDPLVISRLHHRLQSGPWGPVLVPAWSFVSLTELSEYVPSVEQYAQQLVTGGLDVNSDDYQAKLASYGRRWEIMRRQRLTPDLPNWPALCFYPMNKRRAPGENWFLLSYAERQRLMSEHGESGMKFGGKVTQLVTVALGLDDWEWGVTLWARNPEFLTQIVYRMRFDEASARYAEFGPFCVGYRTPAAEILRHCGIEGTGYREQVTGERE